MEAPERTTVRGPTFIHLLARLSDTDVPPPRQALSDRLSQWIDWTHAVALSTALDARSAGTDSEAHDSADADECARVRAALTQVIVGDPALRALARAPADDDADEAPVDQAFFRQRCLALQQAMEAGAGRLRERLRDRLAQGPVDMARLATVDAVMERALGRRERALFSIVPVLLGQHFERLREAAREPTDADTPDGRRATANDAWLDVFRRDMRNVLLAELDVRLQPAEGLLAALRQRTTG